MGTDGDDLHLAVHGSLLSHVHSTKLESTQGKQPFQVTDLLHSSDRQDRKGLRSMIDSPVKKKVTYKVYKTQKFFLKVTL